MNAKLDESNSRIPDSKPTASEMFGPVPGVALRRQIVADAVEWLSWLKGRNDPQTKLLRDLVKLASEKL